MYSYHITAACMDKRTRVLNAVQPNLPDQVVMSHVPPRRFCRRDAESIVGQSLR